MQQKIIEALMAKYQAQKLEAVANLQNYLSNPAGIGEHPNNLTSLPYHLFNFRDDISEFQFLIILHSFY